jgi:hypothetical protein
MILQLCLNSRLKQSHGGDIYELGSYTRTDSETAVQLFERGTMCDGPGGKKIPRTALIKFACNDGGSETVFHSIDEPATCSYLATVVTPLVCSDPDFPKLQVSAQVEMNHDHQAAPDDGHEDWLMQLSESKDGRFSCIVRSTEGADMKPSSLFFTKFQVRMDGVTASGPPVVVARCVPVRLCIHACMHVCMHVCMYACMYVCKHARVCV